MFKKTYITIVSLTLIVGLFSFSIEDKYFEITKNLDIFASLYSEVNKYYVDEVNPNEMIKVGIDAMLEKLDPYTVYIPEDAIEDFRTNATGEYGGIGILSNKIKGRHLILNLYQDSPAEKKGIEIGDEIIQIDDQSIIEMSDEEAGKLLKGQSGTEVRLTVLRNKKKTIEFTVQRKKITIPNISYSTMLEENVGYFKLSEFTRSAGEDVKKTVIELKEQGAKNLIIDLRGNPGGLLNEAVNICNLFVPKGSKIVDTKGKTKAQSFSYEAKESPLDLEIPIAVLIDQRSASASEIVSGVIQDYDRGIIVGEKSYGKGLVQVSRPLSFNSQLKVTTAKYYIPSGRCIQALDYIHKNADGSAGTMADSLKKEFKTSNNRKVMEGGGVDPDISVKIADRSAFAKNLSESGLIFDYATEYFYNHDSIASPKLFSITEIEYEAFSQWMKSKSFENSSNVESGLKMLREAATADKAYHGLIPEIDAIDDQMNIIKSNGLTDFKSEIKLLLEKEIIKRYYLTSGLLEATLDKDEFIQEALLYLGDENKYRSTLGG
ncbi:MAG: S41 family peptidase [Reichenbachiella sp.]